MLRINVFPVSQLYTLQSSQFTTISRDFVFISIEDICIISKKVETGFVRGVLCVVYV